METWRRAASVNRSLAWRLQGARGLAKFQRYRVVDSKLANARKREHFRHRAEVEREGNEPRWDDVKERIKNSPGRRSMGRDRRSGAAGLKRKDMLKGLQDLDLLEFKDEDAPPRVQIQKRDLLLKGIPEAIPKEGKRKSVRQLRAEAQVHEYVQNIFDERKIFMLDEHVRDLMGFDHTETHYSVIEVTRVEVSHDIRNITIYWLPPFVPGLIPEGVVEDLQALLTRFKGKFRTYIATMAGKRFAPYVEIKYDQKEAKRHILEAQFRRARLVFEKYREESASAALDSDDSDIFERLADLEGNSHEMDSHDVEVKLQAIRTKMGFKMRGDDELHENET